MINKLKNTIGLNKKVAVIGIINNNDEQTFCYAILSKENNEIVVKDYKSNIDSIALLKEINPNIPLIFNFIGSGIVYAKDGNDYILNNNPEDYYITKYKGENELLFTAFSRKDKVDVLINYFITNKYYVIDVYVGIMPINLLYTKLFNTTISIENLQLNYDLVDCNDFNKTQESLTSTIHVENEEKSGLELLLFAVGLNYFYPSLKLNNQYENEQIEHYKIDFKYKKQFDLFTKIGFAIFLLALIVNFGFKSYTNSKINKITSLVSKTTAYQNEFKYLDLEEKRKSEIIKMAGFLNPNFLSFYINEIGAILPQEITLKNTIILPIENQITKNKRIKILDRKIVISGSVLTNKAFNNWLTQLREKSWTNKINILHFDQNKSNIANFKLEIILK